MQCTGLQTLGKEKKYVLLIAKLVQRERERERETISFVLVACYVCALYAYTLSHSYCVWVELY